MSKQILTALRFYEDSVDFGALRQVDHRTPHLTEHGVLRTDTTWEPWISVIYDPGLFVRTNSFAMIRAVSKPGMPEGLDVIKDRSDLSRAIKTHTHP